MTHPAGIEVKSTSLERQDAATAAMHKAIAEIQAAHELSDGSADWIVTRCLGERVGWRANVLGAVNFERVVKAIHTGVAIAIAAARLEAPPKGRLN